MLIWVGVLPLKPVKAHIKVLINPMHSQQRQVVRHRHRSSVVHLRGRRLVMDGRHARR